MDQSTPVIEVVSSENIGTKERRDKGKEILINDGNIPVNHADIVTKSQLPPAHSTAIIPFTEIMTDSSDMMWTLFL